MRLAQFHQLVADEFGPVLGRQHVSSHVLAEYGATPAQLLEQGVDMRRIWWALCRDFEVPQSRWLGEDY
ncbi:DUF3046 domain-containing protein [Corynebacterium sp. H128]|uniref:DUF3046 domain-containing protein n=1 Tax=unclassified Corynebacterium TaxID=2624378 RepID=UPI00309FBB93